ncbi:uncharacterized protein LOC9659316 isoform X1 [Selaginella moellendorffii]|uniref:uncharacterized protein LOC9659316 isoform X1 n=1 Tax=Selaginella moellendorffii TaxID=88036 RepID=UPI000D1CA06B|nr:uncharacterized protein LOC9659316 isoform X1 [Selaginella moellendorffii]|eukprot:XP_002986472.2 uncharacterized protein LOC9659316 isoform X1 [Selaginella moellendorffii]
MAMAHRLARLTIREFVANPRRNAGFSPGNISSRSCRWIHSTRFVRSSVVSSIGARDPEASYETITAEVVESKSVGLLMLNRPQVLNALSEVCMREVVAALKGFDALPEVGAIVISGKGKAFAAGVDIKELKNKTMVDLFVNPVLDQWNQVSRIRKPLIAAVNGYALGGGCELAMMCDIILVGEKAVFGQPEIKIGTIPGMGGTQRLIREVGKSRAMEMILTGERFMDAKEACQRGLASRLIEGTNEELVAEAVAMAKNISGMSRPAVIMAKAAVNAAYESHLEEGVKREQAFFGATFGLEDRSEGMAAFIEKRKPNFQNK